uniref:Protein SCAI n=1 Tax=Trichuris muris TaxID=70415 RepID=A0A5S6R398_TRIMR
MNSVADSLYVTEQEKEVVDEFCYLLDKSRQLFNGLRDLQACSGKAWMPHFFRTFEVFTKLWKFQQQNRNVLNTCYGLKRWQIGEIASKIGQLYYHYYIRTSNTAYLMETYAFYLAVRSRQYFVCLGAEERPDLALKKLRYHARFIVVCLLLKKMKQARDLIREMSRLVDDYIRRYDREDRLAWSMVLTEVKTFVEADNVVNVVDVDSSSITVSCRLSSYSLPLLDRGDDLGFTLAEALIVGSSSSQVTFGEFTLDMYWMLQVLERELEEDFSYSNHRLDSSPAPGKSFSTVDEYYNENPRKSLLYKPTFDQFLKHLCGSYEELPPYSVLLLYLSGDAILSAPSTARGEASLQVDRYWSGGVMLNGRFDQTVRDPVEPCTTGACADAQCLYPGDLCLFFRKPIMLIIDSSSSDAFLNIESQFGQPVAVLCSPVEMPKFLQERPQRGSLFTLFLHCPLTAYCFICNISRLPLNVWDKCQAQVEKFYAEASRLLLRSKLVDLSYRAFYSDVFLRMLILRFLFCQCTLRMHRSFRDNAKYLPHSSPSFDDTEIPQHPSLLRLGQRRNCLLIGRTQGNDRAPAEERVID